MNNLVIISQALYQPQVFYLFLSGLIILSAVVIWFYADAARKENAVRASLEARIKELAVIDKFREDLIAKEAALKEELANKQILVGDFKAIEARYMTLKNEFALREDELNKLKERYAELERYVEAMKQALALEKNMHSRLKEEHANCRSLDFKV